MVLDLGCRVWGGRGGRGRECWTLYYGLGGREDESKAGWAESETKTTESENNRV